MYDYYFNIIINRKKVIDLWPETRYHYYMESHL